MRHTTVFWRGEAEQEAQLATRSSEKFYDEIHQYRDAEQVLRQRFESELSSQPMGQSEANAVLLRVEQEALDHVRNSEISTHNLLAQSVKHAKLLNEEVDAKNTGLQIANLHGQQVQAEVARIELLLAQERATSQLSTQ